MLFPFKKIVEQNLCVLFLLFTPFMAISAESEDLLDSDDFSFDETELTQTTTHWSDGFKSSLAHTQTHIPGGFQYQRTSVRVEYEQAITPGLYIKLDDKYRYFWHEDLQAQQQNESYGYNKWRELWVQYSQGACAHKAGRQSVIWGEVSGTFAVDIVTPFDYTEQLLTDYSTVRLAQDMVFSECFIDKVQTQVFYVPEARTSIYQHYTSRQHGAFADTDKEWGGRVKFNWGGGDISLMYAKLFGNTPVVVLENFQPQLKVSEFDLLGISSSIAAGRLLLKLDIGYKTDQLIRLSGETGDTLDVAVGFEYSTSTNHHFNGGIWQSKYLNGKNTPDSTQVITVGWNNTYINDDLALSFLGNWVNEPKWASITALAEYQWDDYWSFSSAISLANVSKSAEVLALAQPDTSLTLAVKYEF